MKALFIFIFLSFSLFYLFYYKPNLEKKTGLWSVMVIRVIITGFSFFGLMLFPFILLMMSPSYSFNDLFGIYGIIYGSLLIIVLFIMLFDFIRWSFVLFLKMAGVDVNSEAYYNFQRWYKTYIEK